MELLRIQNTINFMEENYNKLISVTELENISCCSYRNLQRIFKYACGETIGAFQIRLKLENAYKLILYTNDKLSQIAYEVGFESLAAFSKAFKKYFNTTPKQAREKKIELIPKSRIQLEKADIQLNPEIVFLPELKIYYRSTKTNYINSEIESLWESFSANEFPSEQSEYFGIIVNESLVTEHLKCRYDACCTVQSSIKKLPSKSIFGRKYAKFIHRGSYHSIEDTYKNIYSGWILTTRLEFSNSPIIEKYLHHADNVDSEANYLTEILIPLK